MERDSFVFYRGWWEAIKDLPRAIQGEVRTAIIEYGLDGVTTESLKPITTALLAMAKTQIDANNRRRHNGQKGGRPSSSADECGSGADKRRKPKHNQTKTKQKPNDNQTVTNGFESENQTITTGFESENLQANSEESSCYGEKQKEVAGKGSVLKGECLQKAPSAKENEEKKERSKEKKEDKENYLTHQHARTREESLILELEQTESFWTATAMLH